MNTDDIKHEVDKGIAKLTTLRDEVKVQLHLASLDARKEWDETLAPKVFEAEQAAKSFTDSSRTVVHDLVAKVEDFLSRVRPDAKSDGAKGTTEPPSHTASTSNGS